MKHARRDEFLLSGRSKPKHASRLGARFGALKDEGVDVRGVLEQRRLEGQQPWHVGVELGPVTPIERQHAGSTF